MKKILSFILIVILTIPFTFFVGCESGTEELKMYVPGEYIDEEIFEEFEKWYYEQTGKEVTVVTPTTFDTVEDIMTAVEHDHADFDLLLPSDYAVERLINKGLLQKIDKELITNIVKESSEDETEIEVYEDIFRKEYVELARISDPELDYVVPYMYGTFGIMYDYSKTGKHINSWSAIFTDEYKSKSANKGSLREAMTSAEIWNNRDTLNALDKNSPQFHDKLQEIYEDFSPETIKAASDTLKKMTNYSALWGGEDLKFNMATGLTNVEVALMWSCDAGYVMNDYEDDDGEIQPGNRNLWYVIPDEGGNIYLDNFVISKFAKNPTAANYFLAFICQKEIAILNSDYAGAVSPVKAAYEQLQSDKYDLLWPEASDTDNGQDEVSPDDEEEEEEEEEDEDYSDVSEEWKQMYFDMLFPSEETLNRCGTMRDYGDRDGAITLQWVYVYVA